jgi:hypothetical protein
MGTYTDTGFSGKANAASRRLAYWLGRVTQAALPESESDIGRGLLGGRIRHVPDAHASVRATRLMFCIQKTDITSTILAFAG